MFITKDTEEATNKKFAVYDISKRAAKAYDNNKQLFNNAEHNATVEYVKQIVSTLFVHVDAVYETARNSTKRYPAHTEVKFSYCTLYSRDKHNALKREVVESLGAIGLDLIYKPNTNSYSVKVK